MDPSSVDKKISIVFPVYNEEAIIEKTIKTYYFEYKDKFDFEMILVEDGSTDTSKSILSKVAEELPILVYLSPDRKGYLEAVKDALKYPVNEWVFLIDSDYQFDPKDFWKLAPYMDKFDIILGKKENRADGYYRLIIARFYNFLLRILFGVNYTDMDTGFRLIRAKCIRENMEKVNCLSFFTAEFVIRSHYSGFKIKEVPVGHLKRQGTESNVFPFKKIAYFAIREFYKVFRFYYIFRIKESHKKVTISKT